MINFFRIDLRKVKIESENLILKEIAFEDRNRLFEIFSDNDVLKYTDKKPVLNIDEAILYLQEIHKKSATKNHFYLGIYSKPELKLIGTLSIYHIDTKHSFGSLGILLEKKHWRKGIMTEALMKFLQFCFVNLEFHRIEAQTFVNNIPAVRFFEKLHFINEGCLRENFLIMGKYEDSYLFSLLNSEFVAI
jgi:[ribosomal protein S5]-alanine N-acetyltransferase